MKQEQISAFVDGESDDGDISGIIDSLTGDPDMRNAWIRYHLIGEVLRPDGLPVGTAVGAPDGADVVALAPKRNVLAPIAGLAIAASVAVLAVTLAQRAPQDPVEAGVQVADAVPVPERQASPAVESTLASRGEALAPSGNYQQRLNGYLVNFNEERARLGVRGVHPYVRIVGFEAQ